MGFSLPGAITRPAVRSYRTFSPLLTTEAASGIFSVALSVACALSANPRPLAGMPPYEDRTFLSIPRLPGSSSGCPTAQAHLSMANRDGGDGDGGGTEGTERYGTKREIDVANDLHQSAGLGRGLTIF